MTSKQRRPYEENPRGHEWQLYADGRGVDIFAFNPHDPHNGPRCVRCGYGSVITASVYLPWIVRAQEMTQTAMSDPEQRRRLNNRDRVLAYLQAHGRAKNWELVQVGGSRAMARVHEIRATHVLDVRHVRGGEWEVVYHGPRVAAQLPLEMGA